VRGTVSPSRGLVRCRRRPPSSTLGLPQEHCRMHKPNTAKYHIKGDLSEKQIEADVASFFGWCTPAELESPFRLLDIDEQVTGADKLFDCGSLIYIQFKKSTGLRSVSSVAPSTRKGRSPLEEVRIFRARERLEDDPSLYFQLHARAKTASDLQHNILLQYERPPKSRGIYVAPLLLDKDAYHRALFTSSDRFRLDPFYYRLRHNLHTKRWIQHLGAVPFLREHVSIPPHESVTDHNHYFAYSTTGTDISWHSPALVEGGPIRLSDFMVTTFRRAIDDRESMSTLEQLSIQTLQVATKLGFSTRDIAGNESPLSLLGSHARWLKEVHNIRQFVLLGNRERIAEVRNEA